MFVGKEEAIKEHIYDVSSFKANKKYTTTTREIAKFRQALQSLCFNPLTSPHFASAKADAPKFQEQEEWKLQFWEYHERKLKREANSKKMFALILGQCSQAVKLNLERKRQNYLV